MAAISGLPANSIHETLKNQVGGVGGFPETPGLGGGENGTVSFADILNQTLENSENLSAQSDRGTLELLSGSTDDLAGLMIDAKKSELAVNLTVAVRNKAMDAYKEIMNMQV